jgi:predicted RNase H-like HicB family nuclease
LTHDLEYYLAVPHLLAIQSVELPNGEWVRRAEYPELPNCYVDAYSAVDAMEEVEKLRVDCIRRMLDAGEPIPVPEPPLLVGRPLNPERLGFARWLVDEKRLSDETP